MATQMIDTTDLQDGKGLPDVEDERDWHYADHRSSLPAIELKEECDLRGGCSAVQTQGVDNSCVGQAVVSAIEFLETASKGECEQFSRYFVYYNARRLEPGGAGVLNLGTSVRNGISAVRKMGVCAEKLWPYRPDNVNKEPHEECYKAAKLHQVVEYRRLKNESMHELKDCLCRGFPFVFGMRYGNDYAKGILKKGHVPVPAAAELADFENLGKHAVMAVGYDDETELLTFMNSKGHGWGDEGFGTLSYEYVTRHGLCTDFWTIRKVEGVGAAAIVKNK